ncbi:MAG TPA: hypothetical protein VGC54_11830 [Planctomycetota bacterium]
MQVRATIAALLLLLPSSATAGLWAEAVFCACGGETPAMACCADESESESAELVANCCCEIEAPVERAPEPSSPRHSGSDEEPGSAPASAAPTAPEPAASSQRGAALHPQPPRAPPRSLRLLHQSFLC